MRDNIEVVKTLLEALPYIKRFANEKIVIKYGGSAQTSDILKEQFAQDIVLLHLVGMKPIVVHGGGKSITDMLSALNIGTKFVDGQRVTTKEVMRIAEMVLAFPALILAMVIGVVLGPSLYNTLLALVIVAWPTYARIMRSAVISVKENDYVEASRALGASNFRILVKEILPNTIGLLVIIATLDIGNQILFFSTLSFLGLGTPPPTPEWGAMVADGMDNFMQWWICTFPGLAILSMAIGANFIGDGIRDFLDPKLRKEF